MIRVPRGEFQRQDQERLEPITQKVRITEDFFLSRCEITVRLWSRFINDAEYPGKKPNDWPGLDRTTSPSLSHPVQRVNWYDAVMFCNWLSWKEGLTPYYELTAVLAREDSVNHVYDVALIEGANGFRLPTEAEWEYACRSGTTTRYSCGDDRAALSRYAVTEQNSNDQSARVGSRMCNPWGLHDMHENVWEWCWDWLNDYEQFEVDDPKGPPQGSMRTSRGGSWRGTTRISESSFRFRYHPSFRAFYLGFRVARSATAAKPTQPDRVADHEAPDVLRNPF